MSENREDSNPIDDKRKNNKNVPTPRKNDWRGFGKGVLNNCITTFFIALIGVNFIYLTSLEPNTQDILFPSELGQYFPTSGANKQKQTGGMCSFNDRAGFSQSLLANKISLEKIGVPPSQAWPYTMNDGTGKMDFSIEGLKNWFALSIADVYMRAHYILKVILRTFSKETDNIFSPDLVQIIFITFIVPIILVPLSLFLPFILFGYGVFASVMRAWNGSSDVLFTLFAALVPAGWLSLGITTILPLQLFLTLLVLPPYADSGSVLKILKCNGFLFTTFFLLLTTMSAFNSELDPGFKAGLIIALGASLGPHVFKALNKMRT
jgi:hypothetical protein